MFVRLMIKFDYPFRNSNLKLGNDLVSITLIICIHLIIFILYIIFYIIKVICIWFYNLYKKDENKPILMQAYIIKVNNSIINYIECIEELGCCYLNKNKNIKLHKDDLCYLYLIGKDYNQICYRLKVVSTRSKRKDENYWTTPYKDSGFCYKLIPTADIYSGTELSSYTIERLGISKYASFKKLNTQQIEYIDKYFI